MSQPYALLIVGGGPAGLAAARSYRDAGSEGLVAIVTDEDRMPYQRPPLTKGLLRGEAGESDLPIEAESWLADQHVELIGGRAVALTPAERIVSLSGGRQLRYENCLLATGAEPIRPPVPGSDHPGVRVVRTLDQVRELQRRLGSDADVVVVGSGFIGCEIASSLRIRGHRVTLISDEAAPNADRLGNEAAEIIRDWLAEEGVELRLDTPLKRIQATGDTLTVSAGADQITARVVVMATGVSPRSELAAQAGLDPVDGAVPVSAAMRTTTDGLLAAGDVCRAENLTARRSLRVEHWGDALIQGAIAGRTAAGLPAGWDSVPGFWSTIGAHTLKYAAWGDGYTESRLERHADTGFTIWYGNEGKLVGVLTHEADEDYERGREHITQGAAWS
jgi:3-phenylpropionate/trans-cinnamate dioxygenase ferredoxin reductase subunit